MSQRTLVIDTATAACSVALIEAGAVIARAIEVVGRGHAERLVPMIAALPDGGRATRILVDVGPGSFTGIRVGLAAALGLGLGWKAEVAGYSSTALIAASAFRDHEADALSVVLEGGHGEVFVQAYARRPFAIIDALASMKPDAALAALAGRPAFGNGRRFLGEGMPGADMLPDAADAILLPPAFAGLPPRPLYGRAPDAKIPAPRTA